MATIQNIKQRAQQVKDATQIGENTANRVGGVLVDMADHLEQDENQLSLLLPLDATPTPGSTKPVQSGGVVKDMFLMEFVGRGVTFVENQNTCINWIKGHTYRVYPCVTEWAWGISTASAKVFQLGYVKTDDTKVLVADVQRGSATPTIRHYYDITLPDDGSVKSLLIGGRAASGYVVKCVVVDITYTNEVSTSLTSLLQELALNMFLMKFVGRGVTFVENQDTCINWIKGHTYRVYPWVTEWSWGISTAASKVFQLGYVKTDNTKVLVADVARGTGTPTIKPYYDIVLPDDDSVKSLMIAGRANEGYVVKCVVVDITHTNEVAASITALLQGLESDISIINNKIGDVEYQSVDVTSTTDWFPEGKSKGYYNVASGSLVWKTSSDFCTTRIQIQEGYERIRFVAFSKNWTNERPVYAFTDANGDIIQYKRYYDESIGTVPKYEVIIDIPQGAAYFLCLYQAWSSSTAYRMFKADEFEAYLESGENIKQTLNNIEQRLDTIDPQDTTHGVIGQMYPEEVRMIEGALNNRLTNRFHFIHLSDNHNTTFASASEFLDLCPADFIVNTGDLVRDYFADPVTTTMAEATAPTKPVYLCLGNHDVVRAPSQQDIFDKYIAPTNAHNNTSFTKTYYHLDIDKGSSLFKCIFLNPYDGFTPEELATVSYSRIIGGKMTAEQINWFIAQLQDAATTGRHVCLFMHSVPTYYDAESLIPIWIDYKQVNTTESVARYLTFLLDIVDAFIGGTSFNVTYDGNTYSGSFSAVGKFVAWFAGHTHYDMLGRVNGHPKQWAINVCRPNNVSGYADNSDSPLITWNYVTIDTSVRSLTIYRVGQQQTVFGVKRDVVRVFY